MNASVDQVSLAFSPLSLWLLGVLLAFVVLAISLDLTVDAFRALARNRRSVAVGLMAQFLALPAMTAGLIWLVQPQASVAMGLCLVAACPGGPLSNFLSHRARGDLALSVALTALGTVLALVATPLNLAFWGGIVAPEVLKQVRLDIVASLGPGALVVGAALVGLGVAHSRPDFAARWRRPLQRGAMVLFLVFILAALGANLATFEAGAAPVIALVLGHGALALGLGWAVATIARLPDAARRSLAFETGVQNSGLALMLGFVFFGGLGGVMVVAALWGLVQSVLGLMLAEGLRRL